MEALLQDIRYALRVLARSPGFSAVAVLTLALGIGPNTAIFSLMYGVLLRPLPYPESHRLLGLSQTYHGNRSEQAVTYTEFRYLQDHSPVFEHMAVSMQVGFNVFTGDAAERVDGLRVSKEYFGTLGARPALGRDFIAEEDQQGGASVVILSHGYWLRRFGGDSGIVGRTIALDGQPTTIVGVMPVSFHWVEPVDAWSTMGQVARSIGSGENLHLVGRLKPDLSFDQAQARMRPVFAGFRQEFKARLQSDAGEDLLPLQRLVVGAIETPVRILFGAIALVLLIACGNVANLLLGRATTRGRELAVRVAIGATRGRLVRQLVTESVLLALAGGALGLVLATWGLGALTSLMPENLIPLSAIHLDRWALLFTAVISLFTGVLFGLVPAWQTVDLHSGLKEGAGRTTTASRTGRLRSALAAGEIALSFVLLVGAGLLLRTLANLVRTDPGFDRRHVIAAEIWLTGSRYDSTAAIAGFYDRLRERLEPSPGVRSAAVVEAGIPLLQGGNIAAAVDGEYVHATINYRTVTPQYFETMGIPLKRGRAFAASDVQAAQPVMIVSESFARGFLGDDALGRLVTVGSRGGLLPRRVIGVVGDTRQLIGAPATPTVYIPSAQTPAGLTRGFSSWFPIHVVVRTDGDPAVMKQLVARTIRTTDSRVPLGRVRTMDEILSASLALQRFVMLLLLGFAGLAVVLAAVGIYGVMSCLVTQSTREIGVRIALGALPWQVLGVVIGRGMLLAGIGAAAGVAGALALTRLLAHDLYGVKPTDGLTFGAVTALLLLVALAACFVPGRRATRVDPVVALRTE